MLELYSTNRLDQEKFPPIRSLFSILFVLAISLVTAHRFCVCVGIFHGNDMLTVYMV